MENRIAANISLSANMAPLSRKKRRKPLMNAPLTLVEIYAHCIKSSSGCLEWQEGKNRKGYGVIRRKGTCTLAHRWSMHLAHGFDLKSKDLILHKCDNPPCVNIEHLYIGQERHNARDRVERKLHNFGTKVPQAKLNDAIIVEIFRLYSTGLTSTEIGQRFGVTKSNVSAILRRMSWRHVEIPSEYVWNR